MEIGEKINEKNSSLNNFYKNNQGDLNLRIPSRSQGINGGISWPLSDRVGGGTTLDQY